MILFQILHRVLNVFKHIDSQTLQQVACGIINVRRKNLIGKGASMNS